MVWYDIQCYGVLLYTMARWSWECGGEVSQNSGHSSPKIVTEPGGIFITWERSGVESKIAFYFTSGKSFSFVMICLTVILIQKRDNICQHTCTMFDILTPVQLVTRDTVRSLSLQLKYQICHRSTTFTKGASCGRPGITHVIGPFQQCSERTQPGLYWLK